MRDPVIFDDGVSCFKALAFSDRAKDLWQEAIIKSLAAEKNIEPTVFAVEPAV